VRQPGAWGWRSRTRPGLWGDWNVKQKNGWDAYHALTHSVCRKLYMGTRWAGHGTPPGADYGKTVDRWFAHWLMGVHNGVEHMPAVTSQTCDDAGPIRYLAGPEPRPDRTRRRSARAPPRRRRRRAKAGC